MAEDFDHVGKGHGHAARRGLVGGARQVQKDCAASARDDGVIIMTKHDNDIIDVIRAPHGLGT